MLDLVFMPEPITATRSQILNAVQFQLDCSSSLPLALLVALPPISSFAAPAAASG
jgi:hypothetical protein